MNGLTALFDLANLCKYSVISHFSVIAFYGASAIILRKMRIGWWWRRETVDVNEYVRRAAGGRIYFLQRIDAKVV